jgi:hypothetical protein
VVVRDDVALVVGDDPRPEVVAGVDEDHGRPDRCGYLHELVLKTLGTPAHGHRRGGGGGGGRPSWGRRGRRAAGRTAAEEQAQHQKARQERRGAGVIGLGEDGPITTKIFPRRLVALPGRLARSGRARKDTAPA